MLHVLNGDATREKLEASGVPGRMVVWADVLHEGPVPDVPEAELRTLRAGYLAEGYHEPEPDVLQQLERWYAALEAYPEHEEVVFWYEHDLFDQLIMLRHLDWLSRIEPGRTRFTAVPGDDYLGPATPEHLAALFARREPVTAPQIATGTRAWRLFRAPDPTALVEWTAGGAARPLPFLAAALGRYFEEFPSVENGLGRTERQMLEAIAAGDERFTDVFRASQAREEAIFMGDLSFWDVGRRLARGPRPLVVLTPDAGDLPHDARLALTPDGRDVLAGHADRITINGIDRWLGGVHLTSAHHWRWDHARLRRA